MLFWVIIIIFSIIQFNNSLSNYFFNLDSPSQMGSLQSLNLDSKTRQTFVPDYSVRAVSDIIYIAVKRSLYLTAKKATLLEKTRKSGTEPNSAEIDDEVEKVRII